MPAPLKPPADTLKNVQYRLWYERGWRYGARPTATLDHGDAMGASDAWYDGYLDRAGEREKWHCYHCRLEGGCEEHRWS